MKTPVILSFLLLLLLGACDQPRTAPPSQTAPAGSADLSAEMPEALRHLLPLAQTWGIGDDHDRWEREKTATPEAKQELSAAVTPYRPQIIAWLDSFGSSPLSDDAVSFMYLLEAMEEMGI